MSGPNAAAALPLAQRRRLARKRGGALFFDTLLIAYGAWCLDFVAGQVRGEGSILSARPWLLLAAPLLAVLWQATGRSLGLGGHGLRVTDATGRPVDRDGRAWRGVLCMVTTLLVLAPLAGGVVAWRAGGSPLPWVVAAVLVQVALSAAGLLDPRGRSLPDRIAGTQVETRPEREAMAPRAWVRRPNGWIVFVLLVLTFAVGAIVTRFSVAALVEGASETRHLLAQLLDPDWSITGDVIEKLVETVFLALVASALAVPVAFVISFLGARNLMRTTVLGRFVYAITRFFMNLTRSVEPIIWAIIFTIWVGVGPFAGMLALFVHSVAALGKLYSESIESIDPGPVEAVRATGAGTLQTLRYGIVPQVVPPFLSFTVYRWDINVRMATILGFVGGGGIGEVFLYYVQLGTWAKVGTVVVFITLVVWLMDWASSRARERLV
ncbi:MAG: phosphonate ABC transporter, permease protein PhnE [Planctomycetota bacterium]|jgi:phosphonate transport system permease protein